MKRLLIFCISIVFISNVSVCQVQLSEIPDQITGIGGAFTPINLPDYSSDDVSWTMDFFREKVDQPDIPEWTVQATQFQFEMNITASVLSKGKPAIGNAHLLGVIDGAKNIRGVAQAIDVSGEWIYFLTIYGNQAGDDLKLVFFDEEYNETLVGQSLMFNPNEIIGQPDDPFVVKAENINFQLVGAMLHINLSNRDFVGSEKFIVTATSLNDVTDSVSDTVELIVIDDFIPVLNAIPNQIIPFQGTFQDIDLTQYLETKDDDQVTLSAVALGTQLNVTINEQNQVAVSFDSNWFGSEYVRISAVDQSPNALSSTREVLFTVRPEALAPIVSALPNQKTGIGGQFQTLMLNDYLETNNPEGIKWSIKPVNRSINLKPIWSLKPSDFQYSMSVTCVVKSYGKQLTGSGHILAAFSQSDSTLLGYTSALDILGNWVFFLTVNNHLTEDMIYFKIYNEDLDKAMFVNEELNFTANQIVGDPLDPMILNTGVILPSLSEDRVNFFLQSDNWTGIEEFELIAVDTTTEDQLFGKNRLLLEVIEVVSPKFKAFEPFVISEGGVFDPIHLSDYLTGTTTEEVVLTMIGADTLNPMLLNDVLSFTLPDDDYHGSELLTITATHKEFPDLIASSQILLTVSSVNDAPEFITTQLIVGLENEAYFQMIQTLDVDGDLLSYSPEGMPDWLMSAPTTTGLLIFGSPEAGDGGEYSFKIKVSDGVLINEKTFELIIEKPLSNLEQSGLKVFPNPAKTKIGINDYSNSSYYLCDLNGKTVLNGIVDDHGQIDVSEISRGLYLLFLPEINEFLIPLKVIIE